MKESILKVCDYNKNNMLNGVFKYISKITKHKDIHSSKDIHISVVSNRSSSSNILTKPLGIPESGTSWWISDTVKNPWYQIDLRSYKIDVTGYEYHTGSYDFFDHWQLLGSNDGYVWTALDKREITNYPSTSVYEQNYYKCNENVRKHFSFVRLQASGSRKTDANSQLAIYRFELYGYIFINNMCTRMTSRMNNNNLLLVVLLLIS